MSPLELTWNGGGGSLSRHRPCPPDGLFASVASAPESIAGQTIHFCLSASYSRLKTAAFPRAAKENGAAFDNLIS